jgi:flagellar basal-body rod protein FlgB
MLKSVISSSQEVILERALNASALRNRVISNNVANVNTPGFKRGEVQFEEVLAQTMDNNKLPLAVTNSRHLAGGAGMNMAPVISNPAGTTMRLDGNNVDIDTEMADVAKNSIYYNAVAQELSRYFTNLKSAIKEGR